MATVGALCAVLATAGACDTNARFNVNQITYKDTRILGAWPAVEQNGQLVRQCGAGGIDGFIFNFALTSTQRTDQDSDNSIRPGDVVSTITVDGSRPNDIKLSGTNNVGLSVDCLDPLPDPNGGSVCDGVPPSSTATNVQYRDLANRGQAKNILFVMDVSGSTSGFVDAGDTLEYPDDGSGQLAAKLQDVASDFNGFRWAQLKSFIGGLQPNDRMGIIAFREGIDGGGLATPCFKPDPSDPNKNILDGDSWDSKLNECYGTGRVLWTDGIDRQPNQKDWGRANLWEAVGAAHDFMTKIPNEAANHIVVVTDGPDTCRYTQDATDCKFSCSEVGVDDVLQKIAAAQSANPVRDVQVHFVQFDSLGYRGPDAAQLEVACTSGGHHQFINRTALPNDNPAAFQLALGAAMENVRLALMGNWQLDVRVSALSSGQTDSGQMFSLQGALTLESSSGMVAANDVVFFSGGENGVLDKRPKIRKACGSPADCGASADDVCFDYCTADTKLCLGGSTGVPKKNGTPCAGGVSCCTDSAGTTSCLASGATCDTCD